LVITFKSCGTEGTPSSLGEDNSHPMTVAGPAVFEGLLSRVGRIALGVAARRAQDLPW
jgi:hypothetical protein